MKVFTLTLVHGLLFIFILCTNGSIYVKVKQGHRLKAIDVKNGNHHRGNVETSSKLLTLRKKVVQALKEKELSKRSISPNSDLGITQLLNISPYYIANPIQLPISGQLGSQSVIMTHLHKPGIPAFTSFKADASGFNQYLNSILPSIYALHPNSALVQTYNVNYPHRKVHLTSGTIKLLQGLSGFQPTQYLNSIQSLQADYPLYNNINPVISTGQSSIIHHQVKPQSFEASSPSPLHTSKVSNVVNCMTPTFHQYHPHFFQTLLLSSDAPVDTIANSSNFTVVPTFLNIPQLPNTPPIPTLQTVSTVPTVSPTLPQQPRVHYIPNASSLLQPSNAFFPIHVQPPLPYEPSTFVPISGTPIGTANVSPQMPLSPRPLPAAVPLPELNPHPISSSHPTQELWKPLVVEHNPTMTTTLHPAFTLLPPLNNSPNNAYIPPNYNTSLSNQKLYK